MPNTFVVILVGESERHLVAVASRGQAGLGDAETETGHAAARYSKLSVRAVTWQQVQNALQN